MMMLMSHLYIRVVAMLTVVPDRVAESRAITHEACCARGPQPQKLFAPTGMSWIPSAAHRLAVSQSASFLDS